MARKAPAPVQTDTIHIDHVLDRVPGMVVVYNIQTGVYNYVNSSAKKLLGYTSEELITGGYQFITSLVHPDDLPVIIAENQKALAEANKMNARNDDSPIATFEYRMRHKDGSYRWLHTDGVVYDRDTTGKVLHVMNISIDITTRHERELKEAHTRKQFEQQLLQSERRYRSLIENSFEAVIIADKDGFFTYASPSIKKILGYTPKEIIGRSTLGLFPAEYKDEEIKKFGNIATTPGATVKAVSRYLHKSGKTLWVESTVSNLLHDPFIQGFVSNFRDITKEKSNEDAIKQSQERLQMAVYAGKIGIWDWDIVKNHIIWSDRVYEIHGVRKGTKIGELAKYKRRHHPEDAERIQAAIKQALAGTKPYQEEFRIITPAGKLKWVETKAVVIRDSDNKPVRMLGATTDVTTRKNLEQQKDEFIGIASHELKTPVTSIKAYAQLLESKFRKQGDEQSALLLSRMNTQLNKLTGLISDLLDVTKIETGKLEFHEEHFDANELILEIVSEIQLTTQKHTLKANLTRSKTLYGDRDRIGQVLTNFLTNAVKYSPQASDISITTTIDDNSLTVSVKDAGIGIPKEIQDKVFERFFRVTTSSGTTFPGMGLGLYISSQIIKRQQGKIWVESEKNKGATFSFSLPLNRTSRKR